MMADGGAISGDVVRDELAEKREAGRDAPIIAFLGPGSVVHNGAGAAQGDQLVLTGRGRGQIGEQTAVLTGRVIGVDVILSARRKHAIVRTWRDRFDRPCHHWSSSFRRAASRSSHTG